MASATPSPDPIRIAVVGSFTPSVGGGTIALSNRKARALVAYLALCPGYRETRGRIVGLLWSESSEERARGSLRQTLTDIRGAAGDALLNSDAHVVALAQPVIVDVLAALQALRTGQVDPLMQRAGLFDSLLVDLQTVDPAFSQWVEETKATLRRDVVSRLEKLCPRADAAEALLKLDPVNEIAVRAVMNARWAAGDAGGALAVYKTLWDRLADEFDVEPSEETQELAAEIKLALPFTQQDPPHYGAIPALAVLPFANLSGEKEQEYFADGMTEEIITALSRAKWFDVIARNSSFAYKGKAADIREIGRTLGARYILEGSVRKAATRIRIGARLVHAETGSHIWADRFEGDAEQVFELQDRVTEAVAILLEPDLRKSELLRSSSRPAENLQAYDLVLRALPNISMTSTRVANDEAIRNLRNAVAKDPSYAQAHAYLALALALKGAQGWAEEDTIREGLLAAEQVLALQSRDPTALASAGIAFGFLGSRFDDALNCVTRAYALNPSSARVLISNGWVNFYAGNDIVAISHFERLLRLSPVDPETGYIHSGLALALFSLGRCTEGVEKGRLAVAGAPHWITAHRALIVNLVGCELIDQAREVMAKLLETFPYLTIRSLPRPRRTADFLDRYVEALRLAGLPE